jgi:LytS/YehU family sensor histidine kinase
MLFFLGFRLPIYLAIVSIAHALCFYRRAQERERRTLSLQAGLAKARLSALRMQLQPHFLFNSLNAIAELVHKDPDAADDMLVALASLLRLTLETSGEQELPLSRELEFVKRYLAIEHVRLGDRLQVAFDLAPDTPEALVPAFLLQPLVENAVRHGLEAQAEPGRLRISASRRGSDLLLTVFDSGPGLRADKPLREGIGLANTRARLDELYGAAGTLELRMAEGFAVEVTIPFRTTPTYE